MKLFKNF